MNSIFLNVDSLYVDVQGKSILNNISFQIQLGQQWFVHGAAGSGKTLLANTLAGFHAHRGSIYYKAEANEPAIKITVVDQQPRFLDLQNQSNFYYQQRYNTFDSDATKTVSEDLIAFEENGNGSLSKTQLLETFHLDNLLYEPLIQLSNGENKRIQILKALLGKPGLLILDEPFTGLDFDGRKMLDAIFKTLADTGQQMMLLSSRDHVPSCFNRFAVLQNGSFTEVSYSEDIGAVTSAHDEYERNDFPSAITFSYPDFQSAVRMRNVHIQYQEKKILKDINWEVKRGDCWALTGPNGAGKSTLLSLITADNPQAYANDIYLFDRKRGSGESIWEIKRKIGYLSPELHLYFDPAATAFSALASGLFDTIGLFRQLNHQQEELVFEWLAFIGCTSYAHRLLMGLPTGIQRLILLGRAMIKKPPLLILDEACQGLDKKGTKFTLDLIDRYVDEMGASLIFVSHYQEEFPDCIRQTLSLENGQIC